MHPAETAQPVSLKASASGSLTTEAYWPYEDRSACRWMIIKAEEMSEIENAVIETERNRVLDIIEKVRNMAKTTHTDDTGSANTTLQSTLSTIETNVQTATASPCETYYNQVLTACKTFMQNTTPGASGYNITFLLSDPGFDTGDGWTGSPTLNYSAGEKYQQTFDIYQTLTQMPTGRYRMKMQAYERPGAAADVYTDYKSGTNALPVTAQIYINSASQNIRNISEYAQSSKLGVGTESEVSYNDVAAYFPNNMQAGANYFSRNMYDNQVEIEEFTGDTLRFGIRNTTSVTSDWTMFDNVRLYYFGGQTDGQDPAAMCDGYDITGAMAPYLQTGGVTGWNNNGFGANTGAAQEDTNGDAKTTWPFLEKWTGSGTLANSEISQTITELPNGTYYIGGSFIASYQNDASVNVTGVTFYAADQSAEIATANHVPERYSLRVEVTDHTLTYGVRVESTNASWVAFDNLFLIYDGTREEYLSNASTSNPVRIPLVNPNMDEASKGWTTSGTWKSNYDVRNNFNGRFMEVWVSKNTTLGNFSATQNVELTEGNYKLQAAVNAVRQEQSITVKGVTLNFGDASVECHTGDGLPEIYTITQHVTDGYYDIGLNINATDANWVAWDNVILYYYGNGTDPYHSALANCQAVAAANESSNSGAAQAALAQYEWTEAEYAAKSAAEISAAIDILNNGAAISEANQVATSLVANADFSGGTSSMTVQGSGGQINYPQGWVFVRDYSGWNDTSVNGGVFNAWAGIINRAELYQQVSKLPNGTYKLSAKVRVDNEATKSTAALYGVGGGGTARSEEAGSEIAGGTTEFADYECYFEVTDNTATIGIRSGYSFYQIKDIQLEYVTNIEKAARETDNSYLRQAYFWNGRNALEYDATSDAFQYAQNVRIYPQQTNQLIKARTATQFANKQNKIVDGTCQNLVITDQHPFAVTSAGVGTFRATNVSYSRPMSYDWGTLIMPFALQSDDNVQYYTLQNVVDGEEQWMAFKPASNVAANTPVVYKKLAGTAYSLALSNVNVGLTTDSQPADGSTFDGWTLDGVYESTEFDADALSSGNIYYIAQNQFWKATTTLSVAPFRAYINGSSSSAAKAFRIVIGETPTGIGAIDNENGNSDNDSVIYDLQGRRVADNYPLSKGIYIKNGKKTIIK